MKGKTEIPEFIKQQYGSTVEEILKSKSEGTQEKEISGENKPIKIQMSAEECKQLCEARGIEYKEGYEGRVLSYVCSDESVDRAGDIIRQEGWNLENYRKNPVVMFSHDYGKMPVGNSLREWVDGESKQLKMDILFPDKEVNEDADKIFKMASSGFMKAGSVGFLPKKINNDMTKKEREEIGLGPWGVEFLSQELLEHTVCSVPCNANALQNSIDKGLMKKDDFKAWLAEERLKELKDLEEVEVKPFPNEHACRLQDPDKFSAFKRGKREHDGKEYSIIFGKNEDGNWEEQSYRYKKDTWDIDDAREHCKSHDGNFEQASDSDGKDVSNNTATISLALKDIVAATIEKIKEEKAEAKAGAVLSKKNKEVIGKAVSAMQEAVSALNELLASVSNDNNGAEDTDDKDFSSALDVLKMDDEPDDDEADIYAEVFDSASKELNNI